MAKPIPKGPGNAQYSNRPGPFNPLKASEAAVVGKMHTGYEVAGKVINSATGLMLQCEESGGCFAVHLFSEIAPQSRPEGD